MYTILVVDDHLEILEFLSDMLADSYKILSAVNGAEALEILDNEIVHLIISDIMMPEMDGFEFCDIVKTKVEYCHIPLILLTAKNTYKAKIEGLEIGADAYIEKPFSHQYLKIQIANLLKNRAKIIDHFSNSPFEDVRVAANSKSDELFLRKLNDYILNNLKSNMLDVETLAAYMNMSRPTFYRKVKSLSALSPKDLINVTRLRRAAELLATSDYKIYQVSQMVGYASHTVFGVNFQKHFKVTPMDYLASLKQNSG